MKKWLKEEKEDLIRLFEKEGDKAVKIFAELSARSENDVLLKAIQLKLTDGKKKKIKIPQ